MVKKNDYINIYITQKLVELNDQIFEIKDRDKDIFLKICPLIMKANKFVKRYNEDINIKEYIEFKKIIIDIEEILKKNRIIENTKLIKGLIKSTSTGILCDYNSIERKNEITFLECELYKNNYLVAKNFPKRNIYQSYFNIISPGSYYFILKYFIGKDCHYYKSENMILFNRDIIKRNN